MIPFQQASKRGQNENLMAVKGSVYSQDPWIAPVVEDPDLKAPRALVVCNDIIFPAAKSCPVVHFLTQLLAQLLLFRLQPQQVLLVQPQPLLRRDPLRLRRTGIRLHVRRVRLVRVRQVCQHRLQTERLMAQLLPPRAQLRELPRQEVVLIHLAGHLLTPSCFKCH